MAAVRGRRLFVIGASGLAVLVIVAPTVIVMRLTAGAHGGSGARPPLPAPVTHTITAPTPRSATTSPSPAAPSATSATPLPTLRPAVRSLVQQAP